MQGRRNRGARGAVPPPYNLHKFAPPPPPQKKKKKKKKLCVPLQSVMCSPPQSVNASYGPAM